VQHDLDLDHPAQFPDTNKQEQKERQYEGELDGRDAATLGFRFAGDSHGRFSGPPALAPNAKGTAGNAQAGISRT
jgi:hypothetical protein